MDHLVTNGNDFSVLIYSLANLKQVTISRDRDMKMTYDKWRENDIVRNINVTDKSTRYGKNSVLRAYLKYAVWTWKKVVFFSVYLKYALWTQNRAKQTIWMKIMITTEEKLNSNLVWVWPRGSLTTPVLCQCICYSESSPTFNELKKIFLHQMLSDNEENFLSSLLEF